MRSPTHIEWVFFRVFFPRNLNRYIFFEPCEVPTAFHFMNCSCEGGFFFGQSSKRLSADRLRCEHRRFYMVTSVGLVSYILADLGLRGELLTKQTSFLVLCATCENRVTKLCKPIYFHLPQSRLQASTKHTYVRDTRPFSNGTPPSQFRTN